ncbi:wax ester synthase/diacylglycerol acyltransferase 7-like [Triticum aestivum]|uniref:wax ester synthase/diacylglycerol acyltransferase 7-like n=1 Tax=Triticum aestivum TaxID=4565 RepID=UPI001D01050E|nr:wax ester synthase/diacylglycerol acyltransferase 7-like [Triticum aestivum]
MREAFVGGSWRYFSLPILECSSSSLSVYLCVAGGLWEVGERSQEKLCPRVSATVTVMLFSVVPLLGGVTWDILLLLGLEMFILEQQCAMWDHISSKPPARTGAIYEPQHRQPLPAGALAAFVACVWPYLVLAWNTLVDVIFFAATIVFLRDPNTLFRRADSEITLNPRRRFVHRSLSLDDVKFIKNAMNCTVNDVLVGVTSAALSQYYFRKSGKRCTF